VHVECEIKSDTSSNRRKWNHLKIIQTIPEQHTRKAQNWKYKNSHIGHCTHTVEGAIVKVQNIIHGRNIITCSTNCTHRTTGTLYNLETWFVSGIQL